MKSSTNEMTETMVELTEAELANVDGGLSISWTVLGATAIAVGATAVTGGAGVGIGIIAAGAFYDYFK